MGSKAVAGPKLDRRLMVGKWHPDKKDAFGGDWEFRADGTGIYGLAPNQGVNMKWSLNGSICAIEVGDVAQIHHRWDVKFIGEKLLLGTNGSPEGALVVLKRSPQ